MNIEELNLAGACMALQMGLDGDGSPALEALENAGCDGPLLGIAAEQYGYDAGAITLALRRDPQGFTACINAQAEAFGLDERMEAIV
jgi:hypothetical protein